VDGFSSKVLLIISTQVWTDNWVSKHWISSLFAKQGYKVIFLEPLRGVFFRGGRLCDLFFGPRIKLVNGVYVASISSLPGYYRTSGILRLFYRFILSIQMKNLISFIGKDYILITFDGRSLPLIKMLSKPIKSAYYCVDPVGYGSESGLGELELANYVDCNIAISEHCKNSMKESLSISKVNVVPHGMIFENKFTNIKEISLNDEINSISQNFKKVIGYTGSIHDKYVNFDFINRSIDIFPDCHWVFIGPYKNSDIAENSSMAIEPLLKNKKTSFLGSRPAWNLGNYIQDFDVCLIPYRYDIPNGWERRSPVKILHYLREGKPVVCADVPGITAYQELIYSYKTFDEFITALRCALSEDIGDPIRNRRIEFTKNRDASVILEELKSVLGII